MRFILAVISIVFLVLLASAAPHGFGKGTGTSIPITKRSFRMLKDDQSVDFAALDTHIVSVEATRRGLENFERNTGTRHPAVVNRVQKRDDTGGVPATLVNDTYHHWYGFVLIGTPLRLFTVVFDTSSSDFILPGPNCDIQACGDRALWKPQYSSTARDAGQSFNIKYEDGSSVSGEEYTDTVILASFTATNQAVGAAATYSATLQSPNFPADGILGLAFQSISAYNASPVMQTLIAQGQTYPVFGLMLSETGGELYVGGTDDALWTGEIAFTPIVMEGYWQITLDDIISGFDSYGNDINAIIDTSTNFIIGSSDAVSYMHTSLGGQVASGYGTDYDYYSFPCDSFPTINFYFGNQGFPISTSALNLGPVFSGSSDCVSGFVASLDPDPPFWIIGDIFLSGVYTMFDLVNNQVGFAQLA